MKNSRILAWGLALACLSVLQGCASGRVNLATLTPDDLFARASTQFDEGDYGEAIPYLEAFVQQHLGDPRAPQALMMLGRSHMARKDYVTAATYFQQIATAFPSHALNQDARAATCQSYVELSPGPQLDQEYTRAALVHCESVAENYPGTPAGRLAATLATEMEEKLAEKVYQTGEFYQRRKAFDSAILYFGNVVAEYPRTPFAPQALTKLFEVYTALGYVEDAAEVRQRLLDEYPDSTGPPNPPAAARPSTP